MGLRLAGQGLQESPWSGLSWLEGCEPCALEAVTLYLGSMERARVHVWWVALLLHGPEGDTESGQGVQRRAHCSEPGAR